MSMGSRAHFFFLVLNGSSVESSATSANLFAMAERTLSAMGYQLVDIEFGQRGLLRIFIDSGQGVRIEDCELVSRQLTHLFTVEEIEYSRLEVSSPGLDRPLRRPEDFVRFQGERATIRLRQAFQGRRNFEGMITVEADGAFGLELVAASAAAAPAGGVRGRPGRTKPPPRSPSRGLAKSASPDESLTIRKLVFTLEEIERARLVPMVKF
jgi:ribosome maturation factor RimP